MFSTGPIGYYSSAYSGGGRGNVKAAVWILTSEKGKGRGSTIRVLSLPYVFRCKGRGAGGRCARLPVQIPPNRADFINQWERGRGRRRTQHLRHGVRLGDQFSQHSRATALLGKRREKGKRRRPAVLEPSATGYIGEEERERMAACDEHASRYRTLTLTFRPRRERKEGGEGGERALIARPFRDRRLKKDR